MVATRPRPRGGAGFTPLMFGESKRLQSHQRFLVFWFFLLIPLRSFKSMGCFCFCFCFKWKEQTQPSSCEPSRENTCLLKNALLTPRGFLCTLLAGRDTEQWHRAFHPLLQRGLSAEGCHNQASGPEPPLALLQGTDPFGFCRFSQNWLLKPPCPARHAKVKAAGAFGQVAQGFPSCSGSARAAVCFPPSPSWTFS